MVETDAQSSTPPPHTKLTVNLTARSVAAMDEAAALSGDSKTDAVNRGLQLYAFVLRIMAEGKLLCVADDKGKVIEKIRLF